MTRVLTALMGVVAWLVVAVAGEAGIVSADEVSDVRLLTDDGMVVSYYAGGYHFIEVSPVFRDLGSVGEVGAFLRASIEDINSALDGLKRQRRDDVDTPAVWGTSFMGGVYDQPVAGLIITPYQSLPSRKRNYRGTAFKRSVSDRASGSAAATINFRTRQVSQLKLRFKGGEVFEITSPLAIDEAGMFTGAIGDDGFVVGSLAGRQGEVFGVFYTNDFAEVGSFGACKRVGSHYC